MFQVQYDMVRSFQTQRDEMRQLLSEYAVNEGMAEELERLRKENQELRKYCS